MRKLLTPLLDGLLGLAVEGALTQGLPLVVELFATHKRNFNLDPIAFEEGTQGYHGQSLLLDL